MSKKIMFYLKIVAVCLIPSLYTITYLSANIDPYGNMDQVPVAIINLDEGVIVEDKEINIGSEVADGIVESHAFNFEIINESDFSFDDYFLKIVIPKDFSYSIINFTENNYQHALITFEMDESKNYIFSSIAEQAIYEIQTEINTDIVESYLSGTVVLSKVLLSKINIIFDNVETLRTNINDTLDNYQVDIDNLIVKSKDIAIDNSKNLNIEFDYLADKINSSLSSIRNQYETSYNTLVEDVANIDTTGLNKVELKIFSKFRDILSSKIDFYNQTIENKMSDINDKIVAELEVFETDINTIINDKKQEEVDLINSEIQNRITSLDSKLSGFISKIESFQVTYLSSEYFQKNLSLESNFNDAISFFATPVLIETQKANSVNSYGYGLAPFFVSLSLFVGALILMTVFPLRELKKYISTPLKQILFYCGFSIGQALILFSLLIYVNHFEFISPSKFLMFSVFLSLFFISILTILSVCLMDVGKFIAFLMLVLQLGGSAGTFPIEVAPKFFQFISPFLPMTYSVNIYRHILFVENPSILYPVLLLFILSMILLSITYYVMKTKKYVYKV